MRKIKWLVETGFAGCEHAGEFEVDDDATEEEIDDMVRDEMFNHISWSWVEK